MLTRRMRIQIFAFVVIALTVTSYLSARYVGLHLFGGGYEVTLTLPNSGGAFANGEVTFRGVPVGRIKSFHTTPTGAVAVLRIEKSAPPIPADVQVKVADRSAIGEQYINLTGDVSQGPMLADGDRITGTEASMPPSTDALLRSGSEFIGSVPKGALKTVINQTYDFSRNANQYLPQLLSTAHAFVDTADKNFLVTKGLIENSSTVLSTQEQSASSIRSFSKNLSLLAGTLKTSDGSFRQLIKNTPPAADELNKLFTQVGGPLGTLMSNLVSTAQIFGVNAAGVRDTLIKLPPGVSVGYATSTSTGLNLGLAQTYFDPLPCTQGYAGTTLREGVATSKGAPFNLNAGCTMSPSSGTEVRGPNAVPKQRILPRVGIAGSLSDLLGGS